MTELQRLALSAWADASEDFGYLAFRDVCRNSGIGKQLVRRTVRALARKGLLVYGRGLWSEDGPAGSGYALTEAGRAALKLEFDQ